MNTDTYVLKRALAALAEGDSEPFRACFADDLTWTITGTTPWSRTYEGRPAVEAMLRALGSRIDGRYRMSAHRFVSEGDRVVVEGRGQNRLRNGQRYDNTYCWVCRFEQGQLKELVEYMDTHLVMTVM